MFHSKTLVALAIIAASLAGTTTASGRAAQVDSTRALRAKIWVDGVETPKPKVDCPTVQARGLRAKIWVDGAKTAEPKTASPTDRALRAKIWIDSAETPEPSTLPDPAAVKPRGLRAKIWVDSAKTPASHGASSNARMHEVAGNTTKPTEGALHAHGPVNQDGDDDSDNEQLDEAGCADPTKMKSPSYQF